MSTTREKLAEELKQHERGAYLRSLTPFDWIWALACIGGGVAAYLQYGEHMSYYEDIILALTVAWLIPQGWHWKPARPFVLIVGALAVLAVNIYPDLNAAQESFLLNYLLSSQSAIMWMCVFFLGATLLYFADLAFSRGDNQAFLGRLATAFTWLGAGAGLLGLLVRWWETYLHGPGMGYFPVSNLYEVFVLLAFTTALIYLYYERRFQTRALGGFVMLVVSASIGFLLWYHFGQQAHHIEPLVPALQSWWMKVHVPTNFVAYGAFGVAAMVGVAYLIRARAHPDSRAAKRLPGFDQMDDLMYKSIALGFAFFTIATILGALWAAEAWGGYWSWDPKETWSLIVWLNYAAWLHMRFTKGWRGTPMAWWAVLGLLVTTFCFLGVNIFLSGLHSYGEL